MMKTSELYGMATSLRTLYSLLGCAVFGCFSIRRLGDLLYLGVSLDVALINLGLGETVLLRGFSIYW